MSYVKNKIEKKKNQTPKLNSRLQQISDEYSEVNATYVPSPQDINQLIFEKYKERFESNGTYFFDVTRCIRVQAIDKKEYFVYVIHEEIHDDKFQPHEITRKIGWHTTPIGTIRRNEYGEIEDTDINSWKITFEIPWNTEEIQKLVQGSRSGTPRELLLGKAALRGRSNAFTDSLRSVPNWNEWLLGSPFSDLYEASRLRFLQVDEGGLERFKRARDSNLNHANTGHEERK